MTETTYLMLRIIHDKPLPEIFRDVVEARAYDFLTAKNIKVDVELADWLSVEEVAA